MVGWYGQRCQLAPVPGHSVMVRQNLLDDPRHGGGHRVVRHPPLPIGLGAFVGRVSTNFPMSRSLDRHLCLSALRAAGPALRQLPAEHAVDVLPPTYGLRHVPLSSSPARITTQGPLPAVDIDPLPADRTLLPHSDGRNDAPELPRRTVRMLRRRELNLTALPAADPGRTIRSLPTSGNDRSHLTGGRC